MYDTVHPNDAGHAAIAQVFCDATAVACVAPRRPSTSAPAHRQSPAENPLHQGRAEEDREAPGHVQVHLLGARLDLRVQARRQELEALQLGQEDGQAPRRGQARVQGPRHRRGGQHRSQPGEGQVQGRPPARRGTPTAVPPTSSTSPTSSPRAHRGKQSFAVVKGKADRGDGNAGETQAARRSRSRQVRSPQPWTGRMGGWLSLGLRGQVQTASPRGPLWRGLRPVTSARRSGRGELSRPSKDSGNARKGSGRGPLLATSRARSEP